MRENRRGHHREQWCHAAGCRRWFIVERDTAHQPDSRGAHVRERAVSEPYRLNRGGRIDRGSPLRFTFGRTLHRRLPGRHRGLRAPGQRREPDRTQLQVPPTPRRHGRRERRPQRLRPARPRRAYSAQPPCDGHTRLSRLGGAPCQRLAQPGIRRDVGARPCGAVHPGRLLLQDPDVAAPLLAALRARLASRGRSGPRARRARSRSLRPRPRALRRAGGRRRSGRSRGGPIRSPLRRPRDSC